MLVTTLDAKAKLESEGLHVSSANPHGLWIAASVRDVGDGIKLSDNACSLIENSGRCVAIFPAAGQLTYEVPGSLSDLVSLITAIYAHYRRTGGPFKDAFAQVVSEPDQYLVGRSLAQVNGKDLEISYKQMAQDQARETEALEWAEATRRDVADEAR